LDKYDLGSLRLVWLTGAPQPEEVMRRAVGKLGNIFSTSYGLCELPMVTYLSAQEVAFEGPPERLKRLRSCGREHAPLSSEVRVVNDDGQGVAPGQVGEVTIRGDQLMTGYLNMPQATEETMRGGYFYTGDLATVDEEGYLYLLDRKKDAILSGGKTIPSSDVESVIYSHRSVLEAAVIGVPDEELGEVARAIVVPREGEKVTREEVIELCALNLPAYAVPKSVEFSDALPRSAVGKVMKRVLRERYIAEG
jgi:acyl-CoA synthetase (AMP-forming)/AMP-acid ligase II